MDHVTPNLWTTSISYGYLMLKESPITPIRLVVVALHPIVLWSLFSNLRVNLLHLPWTQYTMGIYRFCRRAAVLSIKLISSRYGCILTVVVYQVIGQTKGISNVAYFVTSLGLQSGLLSLVHFEGYLPAKAKRKERLKSEREMSLNSGFSDKNSRNEMLMPLIDAGSDK